MPSAITASNIERCWTLNIQRHERHVNARKYKEIRMWIFPSPNLARQCYDTRCYVFMDVMTYLLQMGG